MAPKAKRAAAAKFRVGPAAQEGPQFVADLHRIFDIEPDSLRAIARVIIHCQGIPINQVAPRAILEELLQDMHNVSGPGGDKEILCSAKTTFTRRSAGMDGDRLMVFFAINARFIVERVRLEDPPNIATILMRREEAEGWTQRAVMRMREVLGIDPAFTGTVEISDDAGTAR